jgi:hypothetical protein
MFPVCLRFLGMLSDLSTIAGRSLGNYKDNKQRDKSRYRMSCAGRVFFIKQRKIKEGATIQRVLRGNWQEDILWQIHEVLVSQKMIDQHSLDYYIQTLNRC